MYRASDLAGNVADALHFDWTVDTTMPDTVRTKRICPCFLVDLELERGRGRRAGCTLHSVTSTFCGSDAYLLCCIQSKKRVVLKGFVDVVVTFRVLSDACILPPTHAVFIFQCARHRHIFCVKLCVHVPPQPPFPPSRAPSRAGWI